MITPKEAFLKAAELIERDGWRQKHYGPIHPRYHAPRCVVGALAAAIAPDHAHPRDRRQEATNLAELALTRADWGMFAPLPVAWNDNVVHNARVVVKMLRKAAERS